LPARPSKAALAEVAQLLGQKPAQARVFLREAQNLVGPVPFERLLGAMKAVQASGALPADSELLKHRIAEELASPKSAED